MKLVKVYANKPFKGIRFNPGFNVILGEPKERKNKEKDTHNLGKSLLIDVLDFLLLKDINSVRDHIFKKHKAAFTGYVFYLEIKLNSGKFLVIRRGIDKLSKISFKLNLTELEGYDEDFRWDHENLPLEKAIEVLDRYLALDVVDPEWWYRKSISYFLRKQKDFLDVFQLSKFNKGKHREWKPCLFDMLGFDGKRLLDKYETEEKKKELVDLITQVKGKLSIGTGESDKIKGIIDLKTDEKNRIEKKIDDFNFYLQDKEINQKLVDEIDAKISTLNTIRYNVTEEIKKIEESLKTDVPQIDMDELKQLYEEVEIFFPDNLVKGYKDLETFNLQVSEERKKYLKERLAELNAELGPIEKELEHLDNMKSELLSVLKDKDSYEKFKHYQKSLAKIDAEIARLEEKLENLDKVGELETQIETLNETLKTQVDVIRDLIGQGNDFYTEIRRRFSQFIQSVLNAPAIISIELNKQGNIEFHADVQDPEKMEVTAEGIGTTYKKFLCMAFDLAVLITYSNRSFYRFVYHDGALEGLDNRKKINFLNTVRDICKEYGLQYILTLIDSDIPRDELDNKVAFPDEEIVLKLHDRDDSGRLFEMSF
jgi:uncharacterized protein YydD (DUF2326 family)